MDVEDEERHVEQAERRVVADEQVAPVGGQVVEAVDPRVGQRPPRREQRLGGGELRGAGRREGGDIGHGPM